MLAKTRSNSIKVLISRAAIDSYISYDDFVLKNYMLKEYDNLKEETKNLNTSTLRRRFWSIYKMMLSCCLKCRKNTESKNPKSVRTKRENQCFYQNVRFVEVIKWDLSKSTSRRVVKYDWENSDNWSVNKIIIDINWCKPNLFIKQCYHIVWSAENMQKVKAQ